MFNVKTVLPIYIYIIRSWRIMKNRKIYYEDSVINFKKIMCACISIMFILEQSHEIRKPVLCIVSANYFISYLEHFYKWKKFVHYRSVTYLWHTFNVIFIFKMMHHSLLGIFNYKYCYNYKFDWNILKTK